MSHDEKKTMRIALDIDGVMYMWEKTARYMLREVLPNSPYKEVLQQESTGWDWIKQQVLPGHWEWLWKQGVELGLFRYGHNYPGTIQAVRELATIGEVILITHRPKVAVNDTLAWLAYQNLPITGVHLLTNQQNKAGVNPKCDVYLDDKPRNCVDLAAGTKGHVFLCRQPWNASWEVPLNIGVVDSWPEFIEKVRNVAAVSVRS